MHLLRFDPAPAIIGSWNSDAALIVHSTHPTARNQVGRDPQRRRALAADFING